MCVVRVRARVCVCKRETYTGLSQRRKSTKATLGLVQRNPSIRPIVCLLACSNPVSIVPRRIRQTNRSSSTSVLTKWFQPDFLSERSSNVVTYPTLSYIILSLSYPILSFPILSYPILPYQLKTDLSKIYLRSLFLLFVLVFSHVMILMILKNVCMFPHYQRDLVSP